MNVGAIRMRDAFLGRVGERMRQEQDIFFLTADFGSPVLDGLQADCPDRFVNVGIAEQSLINTAAGLALEGYRVIAYAIAPFITMRCLEQIRVNLALLSQVRTINVTLAGVGAGFSYEVSGPTHQALEDISIMRALPNMGVWSPADSASAAAMATHALDWGGIRYVRLDGQALPDLEPAPSPDDVERGFRLVDDTDAKAAIIATGYMVHLARRVAMSLQTEGVPVRIVDLMNLANPDMQALAAALTGCRVVLTIEEGFSGCGGMDALLALHLAPRLPGMRWAHSGLLPRYRFDIGQRDQLLAQNGLSVELLAARLKTLLE